MGTISVRELRNNGGQVLQRVAGGETLIVTMDGRPVAELGPVTSRGLGAAELIRRWRHLPHIDAARMRKDLDRVIGSSL